MDHFAPIKVSFILDGTEWELVCNSDGIIDVKINGTLHKGCSYHIEKFYMKHDVVPSYKSVQIEPYVIYSIFHNQSILLDKKTKAELIKKVKESKCDSENRIQLLIRQLFEDLLELPTYDHDDGLQIQCVLFSGTKSDLNISIYSLRFII